MKKIYKLAFILLYSLFITNTVFAGSCFGITVKYDDTYIEPDTDYDESKLHVTAYIKDSQTVELKPELYDTKVYVTDTSYFITCCYLGYKQTISLPIKDLHIHSVEASYSGAVIVGDKLDKNKLSATITFDDGSVEAVNGDNIDVEYYTIKEGLNTLKVNVRGFISLLSVQGIDRKDLKVNRPTILTNANPINPKLSLSINTGHTLRSNNPHSVITETTKDVVPISVKIIDGLTNLGDKTDLSFAVNDDTFHEYEEPCCIAITPGIVTLKAVAKYSDVKSEQAVKTIVVNQDGSVKNTNPTGVIAVYQGTTVDDNHPFKQSDVKAYATYSGTDYVTQVNDHIVQSPTLQPGANTVRVFWKSFDGECTVYYKEKTESTTMSNPMTYNQPSDTNGYYLRKADVIETDTTAVVDEPTESVDPSNYYLEAVTTSENDVVSSPNIIDDVKSENGDASYVVCNSPYAEDYNNPLKKIANKLRSWKVKLFEKPSEVITDEDSRSWWVKYSDPFHNLLHKTFSHLPIMRPKLMGLMDTHPIVFSVVMIFGTLLVTIPLIVFPFIILARIFKSPMKITSVTYKDCKITGHIVNAHDETIQLELIAFGSAGKGVTYKSMLIDMSTEPNENNVVTVVNEDKSYCYFPDHRQIVFDFHVNTADITSIRLTAVTDQGDVARAEINVSNT